MICFPFGPFSESRNNVTHIKYFRTYIFCLFSACQHKNWCSALHWLTHKIAPESFDTIFRSIQSYVSILLIESRIYLNIFSNNLRFLSNYFQITVLFTNDSPTMKLRHSHYKLWYNSYTCIKFQNSKICISHMIATICDLGKTFEIMIIFSNDLCYAPRSL